MVTGTPYTPPVTRTTFRRSVRSALVAGVVALAVHGPDGATGCTRCSAASGSPSARSTPASSCGRSPSSPSPGRRRPGSPARCSAGSRSITVIAFACALLFRPAGLAVFGGLAVFQFLAVASSMLPLIKEIRQR